MDEFGALTERFGLKPQGKSAPMAASKPSTSFDTFQSWNSGLNSDLNGKISSNYGFGDVSFQTNTKSGSFVGLNDYNDLLGSLDKSAKHRENSGSGASSLDYDSIFFGSSNSDPTHDDIFGGMPGFKSSVTAKTEDLVRSSSSSLNQSSQIDDLLGDFGSNSNKTTAPKPNGLKQAANNPATFDELIHGFGKSSSQINRANTQEKPAQQSNSHTTKSAFSSAKDPFIGLKSTSFPSYNSSETFSDPLEEITKFNTSEGTKLGGSSNSSTPFRIPPVPKPGHKVKSPSSSSIDGLEDFARGSVWNNIEEGKINSSTRKVNRDGKNVDSVGVNQHNIVDDLDSIFSMGSRSKSVPRSRATTVDPLFDIPMYNKPPDMPKGTPSSTSSNIKKSSSAVNLVDDLSSVFRDAPLFGEFQEVEGESEERRRARLGRQQRTHERAARALADLNQRSFQTQHEQEEKCRIAESVGADIKHWAAGKEGNLRALLSTLQYVLWPECGWEPVPLTEMITSGSVRKVYRKAVLSIHPDKVQQRGASLEQKYTAEKVFDILKEAWNKFSKEEL